jgi:hypothetical protein
LCLGDTSNIIYESNYLLSSIVNDAGDIVLLSKDGNRKFRVDINNPGNDKPHAHLQIKVNGDWIDAIPGVHRIYPKQ